MSKKSSTFVYQITQRNKTTHQQLSNNKILELYEHKKF